MIVTPQSVADVRDRICGASQLAVDTETTGLLAYSKDHAFSASVALSDWEAYYFDVRELGEETFQFLEWIDPQATIYMHNAKFDMAMLRKHYDVTKLHIVDVATLARLCDINKINYKLDTVGRDELSEEKTMSLTKYCKENGLFTPKKDPYNPLKKVIKHHFEKIPLSVMATYAEQDALLTYRLGEHLSLKLLELDELVGGSVGVTEVLENEIKCTPVLFNMEKHGMLLDIPYTKEAMAYEQQREQDARRRFESLAGIPFTDSSKCLAQGFAKFPEDLAKAPRTPTGNISFAADVLENFESELGGVVRTIRDSTKRVSTYFSNFLDLQDGEGRLHGNFVQFGTKTGRLSCRTPNLQNVPKNKDLGSDYPIRKCFIPPRGKVLVGIDYDQMEYRMLLDLAGEMPVIKKVLEGEDLHQATADQMGVTRDQAKTLNFMLLYGGGVDKLAEALNVDKAVAQELKQTYFAKLPRVTSLVNYLIKRVKDQGYIRSSEGRIYTFPDRNFAYKAPNYVIQGGCADVVKRALPELSKAISNLPETHIVCQVHDEVLFEMREEDMGCIPGLVDIMVGAYKHKHLPLTCSPAMSKISWANLEDL